MSTSASFRTTRFTPAAVKVIPLADGGMRMSSPLPLQPYPPCIGDILVYWARRAPDRVFLAERVDGGEQPAWRELTYARALAAVRAIGQAMLDRELSIDKPVVIMSENGIDHALIALAAMHIGVPVVPISPAYALASKSFSKLRHVLDLARPGLIFVANGKQFAPALHAVAARAEIVVSASHPDGIRSTGLVDLLDTSAGPAVDAGAARVNPDTIAKILFSSGSTDLPKGVITTQRMMCSNQTALAQVWPFLVEKPPVLVDWLPWSHCFGGSFCFNLVLFHGGTLYIDNGKPSTRLISETVANLREISPTLYFNVPLGYDMLLPHLERDAALRQRFSARLDFLFYAAAALPSTLRRRLELLAIESRGETVPVISAWGATETAPVATAVHFDIERTSMIGLPIPGCEIKMVPNNCKLELRVRGPNVTPGYWRRDDLTREAFDEEGYLRIGDAGRLADAGDPRRGIEFIGRLAEDFKLSSGIWVNAGALRVRAIAAGSPVIQDAVVTGHDRSEIGLLIIPSEQGCRSLVPGAPSTMPLNGLLIEPCVRQRIADALKAMAGDADGSSTRPVRALLMTQPLSLDDNEITDKGYVNQRAVLERRFELVERLHAATPDAEIITARR
jgi:feruloyl-CoA synthase